MRRQRALLVVWSCDVSRCARYLPVAPQLVTLHAVAVVQGDGAVVRDGVEADLLGVQRVAHPDVLPPAERKHLRHSTTFSVSLPVRVIVVSLYSRQNFQ